MTSRFSIDYAWLPREYGDEVERVTLAEIDIRFGERSATTLEDLLGKTVRSSARLSAIRLAEWFAYNWWRLCWEPQDYTLSWRLSHKVSNVGSGYVWPDLAFSSDWSSVRVRARHTEGWVGEPIRYLEDFTTHIGFNEFEKGIEAFIDGVVLRLSDTLGTPTDLGELWDQVNYERRDSKLSEARILEACMGYDPDEAPCGLIDRLHKAEDCHGRDAIREVAVVSKDQTLDHIEALREREASQNSVVLPEYDKVRNHIRTQTDSFDVPWRRARDAARIARENWQLTGRVDTPTLSQMFGIHEGKILKSDSLSPLTVGVRDDRPDQFGFLSNRRHPQARRFAFARLVADHLTAYDNERLLPATDSKTARQKFQRAFAQEFLCPIEELKSRFDVEAPYDDAIDEAAEYFEVSPRLVETALVNNGVLDRDAIEDY